MKRARKNTKRQTSGASFAGEGGLQVDAIVQSEAVEGGSAESPVPGTPGQRHPIPDLDPSSWQPDIDQANQVAVGAAIRQRKMIAAHSGVIVPPPWARRYQTRASNPPLPKADDRRRNPGREAAQSSRP